MSNISYLPNSKNWNPVIGCQKLSPACKYCWSEAMFKRFHPSKKFSDVQLLWDKLDEPLRWKKPQLVACCFTSDLFQKEVPDNFLHHFLSKITLGTLHTYVLLTKRPERLQKFAFKFKPTSLSESNIWIGATIENHTYENRFKNLLLLRLLWPKLKLWLSFEPMLGPINPKICKGFDWVVVGGESGSNARYMDPNWVRAIRDYCMNNNIPFYFKQWGNKSKRNILDGKAYQNIPFLKTLPVQVSEPVDTAPLTLF